MTTREKSTVSVRWMIRRDMPQVMRIERASFLDPWTEDHFEDVLTKRNCIGKVAEINLGKKIVVGFVIYELQPKSLCILNIAVSPEDRRSWIGTQLITSVVWELSRKGRSRIIANVSEANLPAQLFLRSQGFLAGKVLRGYYAEGKLDAYRFEYQCTQGE